MQCIRALCKTIQHMQRFDYCDASTHFCQTACTKSVSCPLLSSSSPPLCCLCSLYGRCYLVQKSTTHLQWQSSLTSWVLLISTIRMNLTLFELRYLNQRLSLRLNITAFRKLQDHRFKLIQLGIYLRRHGKQRQPSSVLNIKGPECNWSSTALGGRSRRRHREEADTCVKFI